MQGNNAAKRKILEELKKRKSKFFMLGWFGLGLFIPIALFLFVITVFYYLYQGYIGAGVVGDKSIFENEQLVSTLKGIYTIHEYDTDEDGKPGYDYLYTEETAENNNFFQELKRQHYIWADDYSEFGIAHNDGALERYLIIQNWKNNDDDIDYARFLSLVNYQSYLNLGSYYTDYNDDFDNAILHDDVTYREYENERVAYNRDVRNFYEKAEERLGSAFFLYPGMRELVGNSIGASLHFDIIHPAYYCEEGEEYCTLVNLTFILSDWSVVGKMYMPGETEYTSYFKQNNNLGPYRSAQYLTNALSYGYKYCEKENPDDHEIWEHVNTCNDYRLIYDETSEAVFSEIGYEVASPGILENAINEHVFIPEGEHAELPVYEVDNDGYVSTNIKKSVHISEVAKESARWFITVDVHRYYSDDLYEKYLENIYIPQIYTECEGCNHQKSVASVRAEIEQYEKAYRYFNNQAYTKDSSGHSDVSWSSRTGYTCSGSYIGISGDYDNHHGTDLTSSITNAPVYPLMTGEVIEATTTCGNYSNRCSSSYTLQKKNSSGQMVSDAVAYTLNTGVYSSLPPVCLCGGGLGNYVTIKSEYNGKTVYIRYGHMNSVNVSVGSTITGTTIIGTVGNTGISTGPHLHIDVSFDGSTREKPTKYFSIAEIKGTLCSREESA